MNHNKAVRKIKMKGKLIVILIVLLLINMTLIFATSFPTLIKGVIYGADGITQVPEGTPYIIRNIEMGINKSGVTNSTPPFFNNSGYYANLIETNGTNQTIIIEAFSGNANGSTSLNINEGDFLTGVNITLLPLDTSFFNITNTSGEVVAWLGNMGNIVLKGTCSVGICNPPADSFIIRNSSSHNVSYIDTNGNLCISKGDCLDQSATCNPTRAAFIIRDSSKNNVSYIDFDGDLCLTGNLYENYIE